MTTPRSAAPAGLLLAAGGGRRMGMPKALVPGWMSLAVSALIGSGCAPVVVVIGATAERARQLVPDNARVRVVVADDWALGMSASLRRGLAALAGTDAAAAVITLVDLPALPVAAVQRVAADAGSGSLRRATYSGRPGHPVLIGRDHWASLARSIDGDEGAGPYLAAAGARGIECGDLWDGADIDRPG